MDNEECLAALARVRDYGAGGRGVQGMLEKAATKAIDLVKWRP